MKKKILFLTTLNLASNPRLVKEIRHALSLGFEVSVIYFEFDNWSKEFNNELIREFSTVHFIVIPAGRKPFFPWFQSSVLEMLLRLFGRFIPLGTKSLSVAVSRRSLLLLHALNKIQAADWIIAHNPGALYPAFIAAKKFKSSCGFDVEDYHPGEGKNKALQNFTFKLMKKNLPDFDYLSFASESIMEKCVDAFGLYDKKKNILLTNSFSCGDFNLSGNKNDNKLHLVWFSQNIDKGRGLENIIPIIERHHQKMDLTLIGKADPRFKEMFTNTQGLLWDGPLTQKELHVKLSDFDAGLAIEPGKDYNNELALSNKIIAYAQSGLFVIATDTIGQKKFMLAHAQSGCLIQKDFSDAEKIILATAADLESVRKGNELRFSNAKSISWENISQQLTEIWSN